MRHPDNAETDRLFEDYLDHKLSAEQSLQMKSLMKDPGYREYLEWLRSFRGEFRTSMDRTIPADLSRKIIGRVARAPWERTARKRFVITACGIILFFFVIIIECETMSGGPIESVLGKRQGRYSWMLQQEMMGSVNMLNLEKECMESGDNG